MSDLLEQVAEAYDQLVDDLQEEAIKAGKECHLSVQERGGLVDQATRKVLAEAEANNPTRKLFDISKMVPQAE